MSVIGDVCKKAFAKGHGINRHFEAIMDWDKKTRQEDKLHRNHGHEVNKGHRDAFQR